MNGSGGFTQTIDWLAFTLPKAEVADVIALIGGDWFQSETGFRGYPVAQLMTEGKTGVGNWGRVLLAIRRKCMWISRPGLSPSGTRRS
jgi:phage replication initiation protein